MSGSLLIPASKIGTMLLAVKQERSEQLQDTSELSDPAQFIIENAKCFLCDRNFVEGEDTFLIFESRLRDDGEVDSPLASVLSSALGREVDENSAHSALLCANCNQDTLEFENLLQRFCEIRYRIIAAFNRTARNYDVEPIAVEINGVLQDAGITVDPKRTNEAADQPEECMLQLDDGCAQPLKQESVNNLDEHTAFSSNADELLLANVSAADLVEEVDEMENDEIEDDEQKPLIVTATVSAPTEKANDPSKYAFAVIGAKADEQTMDSQFAVEGDADELNVTNLQIDGQDIIIYGDMDQDSQLSYKDLPEEGSTQSLQDMDSSSNQTAAVLFTTDDGDSAAALTLDDEQLAHPIFEQQGDLYVCLLCNDQQQPWANKAFGEHMRRVHSLRFYSNTQSHNDAKDDEQDSPAGDVDAPSEGQFECDTCQRVFPNYRLLRVHSRIHYGSAKQYECTQCDKKYSCKNLLHDHMNMHTGRRPYKCLKCPKDFAAKYTLQAHMKIHSDRQRPFKCDTCDKAFLKQQTLTHHKKLHVNVKSFVCDICSKAFGSQHNLDVHHIVHSGQRPFICRTCGKAFARRTEIKDHERIHTGEKPFKCDMCDAAFAQRSNLMSHRKSTHLNEKQHKCDECGRLFKRRRLLQYHINAAHTGERPHKCECGASFVYPEHLKKHKLIHAPTKPYACEVCGKEFNSRDNRNAHRFVHSDKKPYECLECGAGFMRKPLLLAHMKHTQHASDTIIVNQPQINKNGTLSLISEVNAIEANDEADDGAQALAAEVIAAPTSAEEESLEHILAEVENGDDAEVVEGDSAEVKYLQFEDLDKDGQQILAWMDMGVDKE